MAGTLRQRIDHAVGVLGVALVLDDGAKLRREPAEELHSALMDSDLEAHWQPAGVRLADRGEGLLHLDKIGPRSFVGGTLIEMSTVEE